MYLRVRVHATHEYSGFGKGFEKRFNWKEDGEFKELV